jgi:hypothetical protein
MGNVPAMSSDERGCHRRKSGYNADMLMSSGVRKFALTTHVMSSVGWFGAVAAFFALAVIGIMSADAQMVRSASLAMEPITSLVIVPFCFAALLTGILQGLGTTWGLFRYRWVVAKLLLTVAATVLLLVHTQAIGRVAADRVLSRTDLQNLRMELVAKAGAALMALVVATTLSVYKPWGLTSYGRRVTLRGNAVAVQQSAKLWTALWITGLVAALTLFALMHLSGGMHHH